MDLPTIRQRISGGYSGGETPVPIPNTAVKTARADGTGGRPPGRVGRRRDFSRSSPRRGGAVPTRTVDARVRRVGRSPRWRAAARTTELALAADPPGPGEPTRRRPGRGQAKQGRGRIARSAAATRGRSTPRADGGDGFWRTVEDAASTAGPQRVAEAGGGRGLGTRRRARAAGRAGGPGARRRRRGRGDRRAVAGAGSGPTARTPTTTRRARRRAPDPATAPTTRRRPRRRRPVGPGAAAVVAWPRRARSARKPPAQGAATGARAPPAGAVDGAIGPADVQEEIGRLAGRAGAA